MSVARYRTWHGMSSFTTHENARRGTPRRQRTRKLQCCSTREHEPNNVTARSLAPMMFCCEASSCAFQESRQDSADFRRPCAKYPRSPSREMNFLIVQCCHPTKCCNISIKCFRQQLAERQGCRSHQHTARQDAHEATSPSHLCERAVASTFRGFLRFMWTRFAQGKDCDASRHGRTSCCYHQTMKGQSFHLPGACCWHRCLPESARAWLAALQCAPRWNCCR